MTDQKLLQEAIEQSQASRRIGCSPHSTTLAVLEDAAKAHLASLTPVPDQARVEADRAKALEWLDAAADFLPSHMEKHYRTIRTALQDPPVTADADELIKRLRAEKAELMETCVELHKENDQLRATPSEVEKMQVPEWLPIESAPRDGEVVLCVWPNGARQISKYLISDNRGDFWFEASAGSHLVNKIGFTHWMPLPAAPVTAADKGDV